MSVFYTGHLEAFPGAFQGRDFAHRLFNLSVMARAILSSLPPCHLFLLSSLSSAFLSIRHSLRAQAEKSFLWSKRRAGRNHLPASLMHRHVASII